MKNANIIKDLECIWEIVEEFVNDITQKKKK